MLNNYEYAYVAKGYTLPEGLTWEAVRERRKTWEHAEWVVPIGHGPHCTAWGVPIELGCRKADGEDGKVEALTPYEYAEAVYEALCLHSDLEDHDLAFRVLEAYRFSVERKTNLSADTHAMFRTLDPSGGVDLVHWYLMMVATAPKTAPHVSDSFIGDISNLFNRGFGISEKYWACFWLLPNGKHINVLYANHCFLGYSMGYTEAELEQAGWIKVSSSPDYAYALNKPTAAQRKVLLRCGYKYDVGVYLGTLRRYSKYPQN